MLAGEDRGDTLRSQDNAVPGQIGALDSMWLLDTRKDYVVGTNRPVRIIAQGRDASATVDSALLGSPGFQNDGENETTGIDVSDGDALIVGILGAKIPRPFRDDWRVFYTQQHGDKCHLRDHPRSTRGQRRPTWRPRQRLMQQFTVEYDAACPGGSVCCYCAGL